MKVPTAVLTFVITVNLVSYAYAESGVEPTYSLNPAISIDNLLETFNSTRVVNTWNTWAHGIPWAGDIVAGIMFIVNALFALLKIGGIATAMFPLMLSGMGMPIYVTAIFSVLWGMTWFLFILEMMSGRKTMDRG